MKDKSPRAAQDPRFDALLTDAARSLARAQEEEADRLFAEWEQDPGFTPQAGRPEDAAALLREVRLSRASRLPRILLQWAACLAVAIGIGGALFPTQAAAVWQRLRSFVYQVHPAYTEIHISAPEEPAESGPSIEDFTPAYPGYLPDGFVCTDEELHTIAFLLVYERGENRILLHQTFADGTGISIDTEDALTETLTVNGLEALYVEKDRGESISRTVLFHDEWYIYMVTADGISREELFRIAESIPTH